jgi:hypothetical protein
MDEFVTSWRIEDGCRVTAVSQYRALRMATMSPQHRKGCGRLERRTRLRSRKIPSFVLRINGATSQVKWRNLEILYFLEIHNINDVI